METLMLPHPKVIATLEQAYDPCPSFKNVCQSMRLRPELGHIPRGYCGAIDKPPNVKLILVCAEPGDPHTEQQHGTDGMALKDFIKSAYSYSWKCLETKKELFHKNVRHIIDLCFPGMSFKEQMRYTWRTNAVLCSAKVECGRVPKEIEFECVNRYLMSQLNLFNNAKIIALGAKARDRLIRAGVKNFIPAWSAAPPGCNRQEAKKSWVDASRIFKKGIR
jgi:hypothetical protein